MNAYLVTMVPNKGRIYQWVSKIIWLGNFNCKVVRGAYYVPKVLFYFSKTKLFR